MHRVAHETPISHDPDAQIASEPTLSSIAALAARFHPQWTMTIHILWALPPRAAPRTKEQLRRHYICTLHKVIDESDDIVLVLDARDPEGCS